jgi:hypothetical protein
MEDPYEFTVFALDGTIHVIKGDYEWQLNDNMLSFTIDDPDLPDYHFNWTEVRRMITPGPPSESDHE